MTCNRARRLVEQGSIQPLDHACRTELALHLEECANCTEVLRREAALSDLLRRHAVPAHLNQRVHARLDTAIRAAAGSKRTLQGWLPTAVALAGALVVAAASWQLRGGRGWDVWQPVVAKSPLAGDEQYADTQQPLPVPPATDRVQAPLPAGPAPREGLPSASSGSGRVGRALAVRSGATVERSQPRVAAPTRLPPVPVRRTDAPWEHREKVTVASAVLEVTVCADVVSAAVSFDVPADDISEGSGGLVSAPGVEGFDVGAAALALEVPR